MQASDARECGLELGIEELKGAGLAVGRVASHAMDQPTAASAGAQESESDLGIATTTQGIKQRAHRRNSGGGMCFNKGFVPNGPTKKFKVPLEPRRAI